jgi:flagellar protein FlbD
VWASLRHQGGTGFLHADQHAWLLKRRGGGADGTDVIELHRLHGSGTFFVNPDLIEVIEARPDTTVSLVNKHRYVVDDSVEEIVERVIEYRARVAAAVGQAGDHPAGARSLAALAGEEREQAA